MRNIADCFDMPMTETITTHSVARDLVTSSDIVLCVSARTRTIFRPNIHTGGVRGHIIRQKIGKDGNWQEINEVNFNTLAADCGVKIELSTEATRQLYSKLTQLYELQKLGVEAGDQTYVIAKEDEVLIIDHRNKAEAIQGLLDQGHSEEFWRALSQSDPDLASRLAAAKIQLDRQEAIREFESSLATHKDDEGHWQNFFQDHPWMLQSAFSAPVFMLRGETYLGGKMPVGRQGKGGVATDFLFADDTTKSFAVVEIKTPGAHLVGPQYRGEDEVGYDNEVYAMHATLSGSIVQARNQITVAVEHFQSVLEKGYEGKINRVHPKAVLVIGSTSALSQRQKDSFNQFRHALHSLTVITFDELLNRLKLLFGIDDDKDDDIPWPDEPMGEATDWEEEPDYAGNSPF
jgi:Domain of unknown function (DUF4263)